MRLGVLITGDSEGKKVRFRLEQMEKEERAMVKPLDLQLFVQSKV